MTWQDRIVALIMLSLCTLMAIFTFHDSIIFRDSLSGVFFFVAWISLCIAAAALLIFATSPSDAFYIDDPDTCDGSCDTVGECEYRRRRGTSCSLPIARTEPTHGYNEGPAQIDESEYVHVMPGSNDEREMASVGVGVVVADDDDDDDDDDEGGDDDHEPHSPDRINIETHNAPHGGKTISLSIDHTYNQSHHILTVGEAINVRDALTRAINLDKVDESIDIDYGY